ncbi:polysaccharide pyruvyl transferase family protein [Halomonas citrativorans]|uniref:Polysaccharide pyruvyl transferase family protein n=1 Tax=Halomonas citrativorans TaxID=2742612 RepID=A0ABR9FFA1_9GAMM|nr:polysaccharide pyruvyl transferase family protein [Halomonas citrativorans]MBE0405178.1 polysaccharide pyruvyl transferase family protein [Halomonas citrativorans]
MIEENIKREIYKAFVDTLSREPKTKTVEKAASKISDYSSACAFFRNSKEYKEKVQPVIDLLSKDSNKKILIFGAYGNGNLGDSIQALHLSRAINDSFPSVSVYATTKQTYFYDFDPKRKLPSWVLKNKLIMSQFKALFIGGGGLLSHPHPPLNDFSWVSGLEVPVVVLGVGASKDNLQKGSWLLDKSWRVSGRDKQSIESISYFYHEVKFH